MTRDNWILAAFALTPLALFAIGLTIDLLTDGGGTVTCHHCTHARGVHTGPGTLCRAEGCDCRAYQDPPESDPVPIGCGG
ncbi:hypothetical protein AB0F18_07205 [Streptomyces sp. NPDC029216]|uniref:hypothetical protein n=1 Tax=Streptomyces sp. NPDC029216 TaxID=3154701 RepID=UPI0033D58B37